MSGHAWTLKLSDHAEADLILKCLGVWPLKASGTSRVPPSEAEAIP